MKAKLLEHSKGAELFALIFETGDEVTSGILNFAREHHLSAAHFSGIGAFQKAVLGYFDWEKKEYLRIPIDEQVEVVSLVGDIALEKKRTEAARSCRSRATGCERAGRASTRSACASHA